ncbi:conserved hypothetical protein [[Clostridium] ultunense Esp]|nr:conserved hypothetical protein [[Clostridium] ultunense Esp]
MDNEIKIDPFLKKILHVLSCTGSYMMVFGFFLSLQQYTLGLIPWVRNLIVLEYLPVGFSVFVLTSTYVTFKFFRVTSPYK